MVRDIVVSTLEEEVERAVMSRELVDHCRGLRAFLYDRVYFNPGTHREFTKASRLLRELYEHFRASPDEMGGDYASSVSKNGPDKAACDFIAGMTDRFATMTYERLFIPQPWKVL